MDDRDRTKNDTPGTTDRAPATKHPYRSPVLTEYGSVDELVDAGVVGSVPSIVASA